MKRLTLPVKGMYCSHCSKAVSQAFLEKGIEASVDLTHNTVSFTYDENQISLETLQRIVKRAGYDLVIDQKKKFDFSYLILGLSLAILIVSIFAMIYKAGVNNPFFKAFGNDVTMLVTASISILVLGIPFFVRAIKGLRYKNLGMDFLISFSSLVSYILSLYCFIHNMQFGFSPFEMSMSDPDYQMTFFDSTTMILSIITGGHYLIEMIKKRALKHYKKATVSKPTMARRVVEEEKTEEVDPDYLDADDKVIVLAGESIPTDGKVISGQGYLDESSLTGESRPRFVSLDDEVFGGTVLVSGPLVVQVTKIALDSLYSSIINESHVLDQKKGKLNKLSDKIASIFTPIILVISVVAFFICYYGFHLSIEVSIIRAASVLAVSCPCAFGLAVPLSSMAGFDLALANGVLFKTGDTFEKVRSVKAVVFDKTGTLSKGQLRITSRIGDDGYLPLIKGLEMKTIHPIGKAIVNSLPYVNAQKIFDMKELPGVGLMTSGFVLGSEKSVLGKAYSDEMKKFMNEHSSSTLVFLSDQSTILMILSLEDILVPDSKDTISALKKDGIKSYMLTGDRKEYALKTGKELGLEEKQIYSEASPLDKAKILEEIKKENGVICYIGDGINDTLALKASNLSFAPSGASDAAKNSADGIILSPNLMSVEYALLISKKTYLNIIENFCWAICYNAAMIPLAIIGILPMYLCAVMMIVSNLTLTINSLRMRLYHPNKGEVK